MDIQLQQKKLGFFQNIRKNLYLRNINEKKAANYNKLPQYLREDIEVIDAVVGLAPSLIESVPFGSKLRLVREEPKLLESIGSFETKTELIEATPELAIHLGENDAYNMVYGKGLYEIVRNLPTQTQEKMMSGTIMYKSYSRGLDVSGASISLEKFSEDAIKEYATSNEITGDLKRLSPELQTELLKISNEYSSKVSPEVLEEFVGDNPLLFHLLPEESKKDKISQDPSILKKLDSETSMKYRGLLNISHKNEDYYNPITFDINEYSSPEEAKKQLLQWNYKGNIKIDPSKIDNDFVWEMAKFDPNSLKVQNIGKTKIAEILYQQAKVNNPNGEITSWVYKTLNFELLDRTKNIPVEIRKLIQDRTWILEALKNGNSELLEEGLSSELKEKLEGSTELQDMLKQGISLEEIQEALGEGRISEQDNQKIENLSKLLTNDDIMQTMSQEELMSYIEKPSHEKLVNIVRETYGEKAARILKDRPQLKIENIPNMYIFHPEIINEFSIGAVHATLSYQMTAASEFSELARNPEKMEEYRKFSKITEGMFKDTAVDLERKLVAYEHARDLITEIKIEELSTEQILNLNLAINDLSIEKQQKVLMFPTNIQELEMYGKERAQIYDDSISKLSDATQKKQAICQKYFGMDYTKTQAEKHSNANTVDNMCKFYQLGKFVNDDRTLKSKNFSEEDLDLLETLDIISSIDDPKVLETMSEYFAQNETTINMSRCQELRERVPIQYSQEFVDSIISPQKAENMLRQKVPGVHMREVDGIRIFTFDGADFMPYVTVPNLNNGGLRDVGNTPEELAKTWETYENGISTWSGSIVDKLGENGTINSCCNIGLGVSEIDPSQIAVMSSSDAHVSHDRRQLEPTAQKIKFNYTDELMKDVKEESKRTGDFAHEYSEIATLRNKKELHKIEEGLHGGKTPVDYIYTYGKGSGENGIEWAKAFHVNYIFEHDYEAYRRIEQEKLSKQEVSKEEIQPKLEMHSREDSKYMSKIKSIVNGSEKEEKTSDGDER